jgi:hypothetical protein
MRLGSAVVASLAAFAATAITTNAIRAEDHSDTPLSADLRAGRSSAFVAQSPDGSLVSFCLPGRNFEFHEPSDHITFATAVEAVESWVEETQLAASPANPMLDDLPADLRSAQRERLRRFFGPATSIRLERYAVLEDGSELFEQSMPANAGAGESGTDRFLAVQALARPSGDRFALEYVAVCSDAIVDPEGQAPLTSPVGATPDPNERG